MEVQNCYEGKQFSKLLIEFTPLQNKNYFYKEVFTMKKIIIAIVAVLVCVGVGTLIYLNVQKDKKAEAESQQAAAAEEIDFVELLSGRGLEEAVRLPNSEEMVYIEGITKEEADGLDSALRMYEETLGAEVDEADSLAYIYTEMGPALEAWFDPNVDTVANFKAVDHDATGAGAWLTQPLEQALAREDCANAFYFTQREGGGYTMSYGYYLVGYAHSGLWQLLQQADQ